VEEEIRQCPETMIALSAALVLGTASTALAQDADNNPFLSGRAFAQQRAPVFAGGDVFAGPRFNARRHVFAGPRFAVRRGVAGSNWDRCMRHTCVH
jgi:hypothetical protein